MLFSGKEILLIEPFIYKTNLGEPPSSMPAFPTATDLRLDSISIIPKWLCNSRFCTTIFYQNLVCQVFRRYVPRLFSNVGERSNVKDNLTSLLMTFRKLLNEISNLRFLASFLFPSNVSSFLVLLLIL